MGLLGDVVKEWRFALVLLIVITILGYVFLASAVMISTEITCLKHGYPGHQVMTNLKAYCSKIENGTTIIINTYDLPEDK